MLVLFRLRLPFQDSRPVVYRSLHVPLHGLCLFSMPGKEVPTGRDEVGVGHGGRRCTPKSPSLATFDCRKHHFLRNILTTTALTSSGAIVIRIQHLSSHGHVNTAIPTPIIGIPLHQNLHLGNRLIYPRLQLPNDEEEKSDLAKYLASWKRHLHERHDSYRPRALFQVSPHNTPHFHLRLHICGHVGWPGCLFCNDQARKCQ
jgi:hypothetical protein